MRRVDFDRFREELDEIDWSPGKTKHDQMRSAFGHAARRGIDPEKAEALIRERIEASGGRPSDRDIRKARDFIYSHQAGGGSPDRPGGPAVRPARPGVDWGTVERLVRSCPPESAEEILRRASSVDPGAADLPAILESLYRPGEKILIFRDRMSQGDCIYEVGSPPPAGLPMKSDEGIFFLTNPVDGDWHPNPRENDKPSRRSQEAITSFRYLLLESDVIDPDSWLRVLAVLPLPIAAVYGSGGKSIHALVRMDAENKADFDRQRELLVPMLGKIGADIGATNAVQLSRLPTAFRGDVEQRLLYLNPDPDDSPIQKLAAKSHTQN